MSPLLTANYGKLGSVIYRIESGKIHESKWGGDKQKNEQNLNKQFRWNGVILSVQSQSIFPY